MSVRAYKILGTNIVNIDENKKRTETITEKRETFNVWHDDLIFWLIAENGYDCTNNDCCGEIGINIEDWEEAKDTRKFKEKIAKMNEDQIKIIKEIENMLKLEGEVAFDCY